MSALQALVCPQCGAPCKFDQNQFTVVNGADGMIAVAISATTTVTCEHCGVVSIAIGSQLQEYTGGNTTIINAGSGAVATNGGVAAGAGGVAIRGSVTRPIRVGNIRIG
ncbi:hypothetical protein HYU90_00905 [Candidatus Collierbacteria bacterium]|nr:hypothetical protein [Candidatus Collierbacteria bacterium]